MAYRENGPRPISAQRRARAACIWNTPPPSSDQWRNLGRAAMPPRTCVEPGRLVPFAFAKYINKYFKTTQTKLYIGDKASFDWKPLRLPSDINSGGSCTSLINVRVAAEDSCVAPSCRVHAVLFEASAVSGLCWTARQQKHPAASPPHQDWCLLLEGVLTREGGGVRVGGSAKRCRPMQRRRRCAAPGVKKKKKKTADQLIYFKRKHTKQQMIVTAALELHVN